ncbi:uncharacterized protein TNCV_875391 [Trichonephila clavipes]|nr:uncharacterized protein TNCV_875391 [Trichonephila clavipes]
MLYHRTNLELHMAYPMPAGTNYIVLTVQKTAFGLDIIPESLLLQLIQKGFNVGYILIVKKFDQTFYKLPPPTLIHVPVEKRPLEEKSLPQLMQKGFHVRDILIVKMFYQTPYKLPPPTLIHVPAKKRLLEEKSLPFSKKRSKVHITPVIRRVSRRPELTMAPGQIQPVHIPHSQEPVQIPYVPEPVQISDVLEPVQIPDVPEPPLQIPDIPQPPVQIPPELDPFGADECTRPAQVVLSWTRSPRLPAASHVTLHF